MSNNHTRSGTSICLIIGFISICILVIAILIAPMMIERQAEKKFGPPSSQLSMFQRLYLATLILAQSKDLLVPVDPTGTEVLITIDQGESVPSIIGKLWEGSLINNPGAFRSYLQYSGMDTTLKSGEFHISQSLSPVEIAKGMQSSISPDITLTILSGWRLEEIANALPSSGFSITPQEFIQASQSKPGGYSFSSCQADQSLEGYLLPGSYTVPRETGLLQLLPQILMNFESHVTIELKNGFSNQGLDICQAITLASIVQREAVIEEEMPLIASVFYNRLNSGSNLESDPTVQYAIGFNQIQGTWWTNPLSLQDLKNDSPYNTYIYAGLPPSPISNPGITALEAVAFPAQTSYYYFRSACDGSGRHTFSETFAEHLGNECP